jgi:hypothetical protein
MCRRLTALLAMVMLVMMLATSPAAFAEPGEARIAVACRIPKSGLSHQPPPIRTPQENSTIVGSGTTLTAHLQVTRSRLVAPPQKAPWFTRRQGPGFSEVRLHTGPVR